MAKQKYVLSKKHEYLIEKLCEIPSIDDVHHNGFFGFHKGGIDDMRYNTEDVLLSIIENLTQDTQMKDVGKEIIEKARTVFDYYSDKEG